MRGCSTASKFSGEAWFNAECRMPYAADGGCKTLPYMRSNQALYRCRQHGVPKLNNVELNTEVAFLVQACLGQISQNFISISLAETGDEFVLRFVLESEIDDDREAIEDIVSEFYAMHDNDPTVRADVIIDPGETMPKRPHSGRVIYLRKALP